MPHRPPETKPTRILIVDDHQMMCDGLSMILAGHPGAEVVGTCGDAAGAYRLTGELRPDLVLMDVDLPDGSGIVMTRRIREAFPEVKVLVLTGHLERKFATAAIEAGACGYVVKTTAAAELLTAVRTVTAGGFHLSAGTRETGPGDGTAVPAVPAGDLPFREGQVLGLLLRGRRNKEIAAELNLSVKTVETYRARLMKRFDCTSMAELVIHAIRKGYTTA